MADFDTGNPENIYKNQFICNAWSLRIHQKEGSLGFEKGRNEQNVNILALNCPLDTEVGAGENHIYFVMYLVRKLMKRLQIALELFSVY